MMISTPTVNSVTGQKVKIRGFGAMSVKASVHPSAYREYMQRFVLDGLGDISCPLGTVPGPSTPGHPATTCEFPPPPGPGSMVARLVRPPLPRRPPRMPFHRFMDGLGQTDPTLDLNTSEGQAALNQAFTDTGGVIDLSTSEGQAALNTALTSAAPSGGTSSTDWSKVIDSAITAGGKIALPLLLPAGSVIQTGPQGQTIMRQTAGMPVSAPFTGTMFGASAGIGSTPGISGGLLLGLAAGVGLLAMFMFSSKR